MEWSLDLANTRVRALRRVKNSALQIATGCTKSEPIARLHAETRVLPVKDHLNMQGTQFYAPAADPRISAITCSMLPPTRRNLLRTLAALFSSLHSQIPPKYPGSMNNSSLSTCPKFQQTPSWKNRHPSLRTPSPPFPGNPEST